MDQRRDSGFDAAASAALAARSFERARVSTRDRARAKTSGRGMAVLLWCFNPVWICAHILAAAQGIHVIFGLGSVLSTVAAALVSGVPVLGVWLAVSGAHASWGWSLGAAIVVFATSWVVLAVYWIAAALSPRTRER